MSKYVIKPFSHDFYNNFTHCFCSAKNGIETFIDFFKHLGYLGIYLGLTWLEYCVGKLRGYVLAIEKAHGTCVFHGPIPVLENELSIGINT